MGTCELDEIDQRCGEKEGHPVSPGQNANR
jgi:hypothetical protein